ncbi:carbohydrate ABC transporter permease [bacterium]|nr:MAG: carbohydrate ABC transporter permease [bacterium]
MVTTSLKSDQQLYAGSTEAGQSEEGAQSLSLASFLPRPPHPENYPAALRAIPFRQYLRNTIVLCVLNVIGAVVSSAVVAYGFARVKFDGSKVLFALMIATMAIPGQVTMVPVFALFRALGWYDTMLPLVVPSFFGAAFYIFLLVQFFRTLPEEMAEAARLDGAGEWTIFRRVMLPLARPALATVALFQFLGTWNDFFGPLLYLNDPSRYTLAYGLQQFLSAQGGQWPLLMAASILFALPIVVLFFLAQRTFIQGISTTGMK